MPPDDGVSEIPIFEREEDVMADVALQELLLGAQAQNLTQMGGASTFSHALLDRISAKKFDELDLLQAAAAKELGKAGENPRFQPQSEPSASGKP